MARYRIEVDCDLSEDEFVAYLSQEIMNPDVGYQTEAGKDVAFENLFVFPVTGPGYPYPGNGLPLSDAPASGGTGDVLASAEPPDTQD